MSSPVPATVPDAHLLNIVFSCYLRASRRFFRSNEGGWLSRRHVCSTQHEEFCLSLLPYAQSVWCCELSLLRACPVLGMGSQVPCPCALCPRPACRLHPDSSSLSPRTEVSPSRRRRHRSLSPERTLWKWELYGDSKL